MIPSDLPNISTDWARGKTHSISWERWSSGSWTWGTCMNQNRSPCPHYITGERFCLENNNTVKLKHLYLFWGFFLSVRCKMKLLISFFLTKHFIVPCQGRLEKAQAWANWNLQVSNSHFSFSTWSFALLGFCSQVVVSVGISNDLYLLNKNTVETLSSVSDGCRSAVRREEDLSGQTLVGKARQPLAKY